MVVSSFSKVHDCGSSEGAGVSCTGKQSSEQIASRRQKKVRLGLQAAVLLIAVVYNKPLVFEEFSFKSGFKIRYCQSYL